MLSKFFLLSPHNISSFPYNWITLLLTWREMRNWKWPSTTYWFPSMVQGKTMRKKNTSIAYRKHQETLVALYDSQDKRYTKNMTSSIALKLIFVLREIEIAIFVPLWDLSEDQIASSCKVYFITNGINFSNWDLKMWIYLFYKKMTRIEWGVQLMRH